jgi:hypothetical protein
MNRQIRVIALDYGGTISLDRIDHLIGQKPVDPAAAAALVGNHLENDVMAPARQGIRTALVRPLGLRDGEVLPDGALLINHVRELPSLLEAA